MEANNRLYLCVNLTGLLLSGLIHQDVFPFRDLLMPSDLQLFNQTENLQDRACKLLLHATAFSSSAAETCKQDKRQV